MADTEDELQNGELESDDDTAETESERDSRARLLRDAERLTPEELAIRRAKELEQQFRDEDELDALRDEEIARARKEQRRLDEVRDRHQLTAEQDTARAIEVAEVFEESRDRNRRDAGIERSRGRSERGRGNSLLDEADRRDDPGAGATAAAGRAHLLRASDADRRAVNLERDADRDNEMARDSRSEAADAQKDAPAAGAVQSPPPEAPVARVRKPVWQKKAKRDKSGLPDISLAKPQEQER